MQLTQLVGAGDPRTKKLLQASANPSLADMPTIIDLDVGPHLQKQTSNMRMADDPQMLSGVVADMDGVAEEDKSGTMSPVHIEQHNVMMMVLVVVVVDDDVWFAWQRVLLSSRDSTRSCSESTEPKRPTTEPWMHRVICSRRRRRRRVSRA